MNRPNNNPKTLRETVNLKSVVSKDLTIVLQKSFTIIPSVQNNDMVSRLYWKLKEIEKKNKKLYLGKKRE